MGFNRKRGVQGEEETPKLAHSLKSVSLHVSVVGIWWVQKSCLL